ncbi:MAG TPA: MBOAT family protein [Polyangiaceae bacterium]|nr:MBOAT family protein [Polyangiaceae bacterium]HNZ24952.1 MBOAT family protein [Polyangiaceae bacterium]HOD24090.1 MBOAT family protein [Polyangiaceae bacterium]HOE51612.1 MBOAT family protein [Polyangiaceae bacterium]HOH02773.1 MBOAT family protein [Polyangiaceae bacterium]
MAKLLETRSPHGVYGRPVLFNTLQFAWFFLAVFVISWLLVGRPTLRRLFLLAASYYFYGSWDWRFLGLLVLSTVIDFVVGYRMSIAPKHKRRGLLLLSVVSNLGILGFFKYYNFFIDSVVTTLHSVGLHADIPTLQIILPVGISFYTFQTMAYTIDVYRDRSEVCKDPLTFALYVSFFPQLVAGPIERAQNLIPQLARDPTAFSQSEAGKALFLIAIGLIKKVVIGDYLAINLVDRVFTSPSSYSALEVLAGVYGYATQIYCDFSGYTDIAIGCGILMGVRFNLNFNSPYKAHNLQEFWHRWHISLSTWLRDYLYIPLGGSRNGSFNTYKNLMITMLLGGLWHGAGWQFMFWGFLHGGLLGVTRAWQRWRGTEGAYVFPTTAWGLLKHAFFVLLTFHYVCLGWVFFRAESFGKAWAVLKQISTLTTYHPNLHGWVLLALVVGLVSHYTPDSLFEWARSKFAALPWYVQGLLLFVVAFVLREAASADAVPFIYFQF